MAIKPITVTLLSTYLKQIFDAEELLHNISVVGEISGYSNIRGTAYFTLKDENSALSCVCFYANNLNDFKNGDSVVVIGSPQYYVKGGKLNFNVVKIEHYGENILYQKFLELKSKLEQKGYFDESIKKPIPKNIKRIGVVSSEGGAVIQDIINVRTRRNPSIDIVLYPVKVQGVGAEYEIAKGIEFFDNYNVDAIVVARGGGSMEDLQPFNTEIVADATFNCKKFIMSAVGHETDFTIIDFCSDLRAPTPSVASELLCDSLIEKQQHYGRLINSLLYAYEKYYSNKQQIFCLYVKQLMRSYQYIEQDVKNVYNLSLNKFIKILSNYYTVKEKELLYRIKELQKLNPKEILKLGYASVSNNKKYVTSVSDVEVGNELTIQLKDGRIQTRVLEVK